jgi:thiamine-phosphate pyrophosphorylase
VCWPPRLAPRSPAPHSRAVAELPRPCVCLVTDRRQVLPDARTLSAELVALDRWLDEALAARIDLIQVRERDLDARVLESLVRRLVTRAGSTLIVVNDRADIARASGAHGVHLRAQGPTEERIRTVGPPGWIIGRSIHDPGEVRLHPGVAYFLFGTVFPSRSKEAGTPTTGIEGLTAAVRSSRLPVLAIGGITPARATECMAAGAAGVAAIGVFLPAGSRPDAIGPARGVAAFRSALRGT